MAEHRQEQDPMQGEFHASVTEEDLAGPNQEDVLHQYQHAERENPAELREELGQKQDRERLVQVWIGQNEGVRPQHEAPVVKAKAALAELRSEIAAGPTAEVVAEGQALIDKAQQAIDRLVTEEHTPDERLVAGVADAKEKLEEWLRKIAVVELPKTQRLVEFYNRHHKDDPDFELREAKEPEQPKTDFAGDERATILADSGASVKERLEKTLSKAQGELQTSEREYQDRTKATKSRLKGELTKAQTRASEIQRAYVDRLRSHEPDRIRYVETTQQRLSQHEQRQAEYRAELAQVQTEIQHLQARLKAAEAASGQPQAPDAAEEQEDK